VTKVYTASVFKSHPKGNSSTLRSQFQLLNSITNLLTI